ncbi:hypothetical protein B1690_05250 [Geobacillus sp. 46C-IIa]|nr:hypothetical protein B1690_05250 [Geobacillus sp. 46C-IIa]
MKEQRPISGNGPQVVCNLAAAAALLRLMQKETRMFLINSFLPNERAGFFCFSIGKRDEIQ